MQNKAEILAPDSYYHIYNRANGSEQLFLNDGNYRFFLQKYTEYILPIAHTYCYCLMPNHFHFLIKLKSESELKETLKTTKDLQGFKNLEGLLDLEKSISNRFSNFFNAYAKAFNKQNNRKGSLFMHPYKRKKIASQNYLHKIVQYIHFNPVEANLCKKIHEWKYSSYKSLISDSTTELKRNEVIEWFNDIENFKFIHSHTPLELNEELF